MKRDLAAAMVALMACNMAWAHDGAEDGQAHTHWWLELDPAWYAGAGVGQSAFDGFAFVNDGSFTSQHTDDTGTTLRLFGGLLFGRHLALELGYADFGEASFRAQSDGSSGFWNAGPQAAKVAIDAYDLALVGRLPFGDDWGVFGKAGYTWWEAEAPVTFDAQCCGAIVGTFSDDGREFTYGGGAQYDGLRPMRIIAEYGVLPFEPGFDDDLTLDWLSVSVAYLF